MFLNTLLLLGVLDPPVIPPPYVPDEELARFPVIVVARWSGDPVKPATTGCGHRATRIEVKSVVRGSVDEGKLEIHLGPALTWIEPAGGPILAQFSTEMIGDWPVEEWGLWCLERSKDPDSLEPPVLTTYRGVQPPSIEAYLRALGGKDPAAGMAGLLASQDEETVIRALAWVSGRYPPTSLERPPTVTFALGAGKTPKPAHPGFAPRVRKLLDHESERVRHLALGTWVRLAGETTAPELRRRVVENDWTTRVLVAGLLAQIGDRDAAPLLAKAGPDTIELAGFLHTCRTRALAEVRARHPKLGALDQAARAAWIERGQWMPRLTLAGRVCGMVADLGDVRAAPFLFSFLDLGDSAGYAGDDYDVPAFKARAALKELTGITFPLAREYAIAAWAGTADVRDPAKRRAEIHRRFPPNGPFEVRIQRRESGLFAVVRNRSGRTLAIRSRPDHVVFRSPSRVSSSDTQAPRTRSDFVDVAPGGTLEVDLSARLGRGLGEGRISLVWWNNGWEHGARTKDHPTAWIGVVSARSR